MPIHRTRIGRDIVAEFAVPAERTSKVAIIAAGVPSMPSKKRLVEFLAKQGFFVIFPRYRGTWESGGTFLAHEPTKDIRNVVEHVVKHRSLESLWEEKQYHLPKKPGIYIFAGSFGGPAGLLLSTHPAVERVFCVAPVVDWRMESKAEPHDWLFTLMKRAYGNGFRVTRRNWNKLGRSSFYNPARQPEKIDPKKILIFHAQDDESVPVETVETFAKKHGIKTHIKKSGGHLSLSAVQNAFYWNRIKEFTKKK